MKPPKHPLQPFVVDRQGTVRFKQNTIVKFLLEAGPFDMNQLALMNFTEEDRCQFAQLIGYSHSGWLELVSYVSEADAQKADKQREKFDKERKKHGDV